MSVDTQMIDRMSAALDALRTGVLAGDLEAIAPALEALTPALDRLEVAAATADPALGASLLRLRDKAARLAPTLAAARAGIEDARALMRGLARAEQQSTYDSSGRRCQLAAPASGFAHRV